MSKLSQETNEKVVGRAERLSGLADALSVLIGKATSLDDLAGPLVELSEEVSFHAGELHECLMFKLGGRAAV